MTKKKKARKSTPFKSEVRPRKADTSDQATAQSESVRPATHFASWEEYMFGMYDDYEREVLKKTAWHFLGKNHKYLLETSWQLAFQFGLRWCREMEGK